jgi:two-component system LytT family response regulator
MILNAIIVDDEEHSRKSLYYLVEANCPTVKISGMAQSVAEARELLKTHFVDIVFLDIAMPRENGFELLPDLERNETSVIFTTAFDQYALRAIKASAIDYLLKPVNIEELVESIQKVAAWKTLKRNQNLGNHTYIDSLKSLAENINSSEDIRKISLPDMQGFTIKDINEIVYVEAVNNYTRFNFSNCEPIIVSKAMKDYEDFLNPQYFVRIHKSTIINLYYLKDYSNKSGFTVTMYDLTKLSVSRRRTGEFLDRAKLFLK